MCQNITPSIPPRKYFARAKHFSEIEGCLKLYKTYNNYIPNNGYNVIFLKNKEFYIEFESNYNLNQIRKNIDLFYNSYNNEFIKNPFYLIKETIQLKY